MRSSRKWTVATLTLIAGALFVVSIRFPSRSASNLAPQIQSLLNKSPGALQKGIFFHSSVALESRGVLLDDMAWLASKKVLHGSKAFAESLEIANHDISGLEALAWILDRIQVVSGTQWCAYRARIVVSNLDPENPESVFNSRGNCADPVSDDAVYGFALPMDNWRRAERSMELDGFIVDDHVDLEPRDRLAYLPKIVAISQTLQNKYPSQIARILRLALLVHEAGHVTGRASHVVCQSSSWANAIGGLPTLGYTSSIQKPGLPACDRGRSGSLAPELLFIRSLASECGECTTSDQTRIRLWQINRWAHVEVDTQDTDTLARIKRLTGIASSTPLKTVPVAEYFALMREGLISSNGASKYVKQIDSIVSLLQKKVNEDKLNPIWNKNPPQQASVSIEKTSSELEAIEEWLRQAQRAPSHNVNLTFVPPCSQYRSGCPPY